MCDKQETRDPGPYPGTSRPRPDRDQGEAAMPTMAYRPNTSIALRERAGELRREADALDRLAQVAEALLPGDPADGALWNLLHKAARRA